MCPSGKVTCAVALIYTECDGDFFGAVSLKVLLIESLGQDHSAINTHVSVIAAPSKTSRSVKKRDFAQGYVECVQKSMLFNRHLTIASI